MGCACGQYSSLQETARLEGAASLVGALKRAKHPKVRLSSLGLGCWLLWSSTCSEVSSGRRFSGVTGVPASQILWGDVGD